MFIYKINSIEKLLTVVKNREYVLNNPELCKLLENPLIKDDTELAILYNEYKLSYPNGAKAFIDYYYTHGPELDTGSLTEWRKTIQNDPDLVYEANINDTRIQEIWDAKKKNKDYSWIGDIIDCLSKPCQYLGLISPNIGSLADTQAKYNNKNTNGQDESITLLGIPTYMVNKMPKYIAQGITQLTDMISVQSQDVVNVLTKNGKTVKEDPYVIKRSELIGGDLLGDIASRMGDCFRIYEYQRRYNPYDYSQNKEKADKFGTVVYDENGNPKTVSPNGNPTDTVGKNNILSDNRRLSPKTTAQDIILTDVGNVDSSSAMPMSISVYNPALSSDKKFYLDQTTDNEGSEQGLVSGTSQNGVYTLPNSVAGAEALAVKDIDLRCGCASKYPSVMQYFQALLKTKFPTATIPTNFKETIIEGYKSANLNVTLFFPGGQRTLPVFDCGGGGAAARQGIPWVDITSQYFLTKDGINLGKIYTSAGAVTTPSAMPQTIKSSQLKGISRQNTSIKALKVTGVQNNRVNGLFFFSKSYCEQRGLDVNIYGQPGSASPIKDPKPLDDVMNWDTLEAETATMMSTTTKS